MNDYFYFPIWERYFYKEFIRAFLSILFGIFALYVVVDLMAHLKYLMHGYSTFSTWFVYYAANFSKRLDILVPFSLLLTSIRTIFSMQQKGEFVAMLASGVSKKTLLKPFLMVSFLATFGLYANYECTLPLAIPRLNLIADTAFGKEEVEKYTPELKEIILQDSSKIFYSSYNRKLKQFKDLFWIRTPDEIYHMKTLTTLDPSTPIGAKVDKIVRGSSDTLEKVASFDNYTFKDLKLTKEILKNSLTSAEEQSMSQLAIQLPLCASSTSKKSREIRATFYSKIAFPWLCILAFIAPVPFCFTFSRNKSPLALYLIAIASLFCFNVILEAAFVIAKSEIIPSFLAIALPWGIAGFFFGKKYVRQ